MTNRLWMPLTVLALSGCQCFVPVDECRGGKCFAKDAGSDGGSDGGVVPVTDAGTNACALWDGGGVGKCAAVTGYVATATECRGDCVTYPLSAPGLFPNLPACIGCGCDPAK